MKSEIWTKIPVLYQLRLVTHVIVVVCDLHDIPGGVQGGGEDGGREGQGVGVKAAPEQLDQLEETKQNNAWFTSLRD